MSKYIRDVFSDYKNNNNLLDAVVENVTLYKKHNFSLLFLHINW